MASLLEMILKSQNGDLVKQIGNQHGLEPNQAFDAIRNLLPSLTKGMNQNIQKEGGLGNLLDALNKGKHQKYIEDPRAITTPQAIDDGNSILGHILGSKDRSREVARQASQATGIDYEILKKILPQVAGASMGGMSKRVNSRDSGSLIEALTKASQQSGGNDGGLGNILGQVLGGQAPQAAPPPKRGGLGGLLGSIFGRKKAPPPPPQPKMPDLGGILGGILGGKSAQELPPQVQQQTRSVLGKMLDLDGDGKTMDDIFNMAKKML
ncbi:MAG: DUF937 domain-containing protein [Gammaproteobacteria bacterium]|nr:DUF937 domain-containing protein [Gammaproteobacteria bacterium]NNM12763.1 DUF937 domain-containing protein [Gammaproteobacteria bacterium]